MATMHIDDFIEDDVINITPVSVSSFGSADVNTVSLSAEALPAEYQGSLDESISSVLHSSTTSETCETQPPFVYSTVTSVETPNLSSTVPATLSPATYSAMTSAADTIFQPPYLYGTAASGVKRVTFADNEAQSHDMREEKLANTPEFESGQLLEGIALITQARNLGAVEIPFVGPKCGNLYVKHDHKYNVSKYSACVKHQTKDFSLREEDKKSACLKHGISVCVKSDVKAEDKKNVLMLHRAMGGAAVHNDDRTAKRESGVQSLNIAGLSSISPSEFDNIKKEEQKVECPALIECSTICLDLKTEEENYSVSDNVDVTAINKNTTDTGCKVDDRLKDNTSTVLESNLENASTAATEDKMCSTNIAQDEQSSLLVPVENEMFKSDQLSDEDTASTCSTNQKEAFESANDTSGQKQCKGAVFAHNEYQRLTSTVESDRDVNCERRTSDSVKCCIVKKAKYKPQGKRSAAKEHLNIHKSSSNAAKPDECTKSTKISKCKFNVHTGTHHECTVCAKVYTYQRSLQKHMKTHNVCGKERSAKRKDHTMATKVKNQMRQVQTRAHPNEKKYHVCTVCTNSFSTLGQLQRHKLKHSTRKLHVCSCCDKQFKSPYDLAVHTGTHTKEKPHVCTVCTKSHSTAGHLHRHMLKHSGKKPYVCTQCSKGFISPSDLAVHTRTHTKEKPYVCTVCTKGFTTSSHLHVHARTHTGDRPYVCTVLRCGKALTTSSDCKRHVRTHEEQKAHTCLECGRRYTRASHVQRHMTRAHMPKLRCTNAQS